MAIVVLTGASGSGKTTIADVIASSRRGSVDVYRFDEIGVPSPEAMVAGWGSGEEWQKAATFVWLKRIATERERRGSPVLFEGQMRLAFIHEALAAAQLEDARIVLVDCDDESRVRRLTRDRRQPALADARMMAWAAHLRDEASSAGVEALDTARLSIDECVRFVADRLGIGARGPMA